MKSLIVIIVFGSSLASFANCVDENYKLQAARDITLAIYSDLSPLAEICRDQADSLSRIKKSYLRDKEPLELELKNYRELKTEFDYQQIGDSYQNLCHENKYGMDFLSVPEVNPLFPEFKELVFEGDPYETCLKIGARVIEFRKEVKLEKLFE